MSIVQPGGGGGSQKRSTTSGGKPGSSGTSDGDTGPASGSRSTEPSSPGGTKPGTKPTSGGTKPGTKSGTKPGTTPVAKRQTGRPPAKGAQGRSGSGQKGAPAGKGRPGTRIDAPPPRRFSPSTMAFIAVGVVVVIVVVFVVVKVVGGGSTSSNTAAPTVTPADPVVVAQLTGVSNVTANTVAIPSGVQPPGVAKHQQPLVIDGKPGVVYIGGEFCPYCGAERWGLIQALSRFGTFSNLHFTTSSPWDTDPSTATFTFVGSSYSSPYITFDAKEAESNDTTGPGTRTQLQSLTSQEQTMWSKYSSYFGLASTGFPFVNIGNKVFITGPSYNPQVLAGLTHQQIASALTQANSPVTQAIVGTANYITAGICSVDDNMPSSVCSQSAVVAAKHDLGVS